MPEMLKPTELPGGVPVTPRLLAAVTVVGSLVGSALFLGGLISLGYEYWRTGTFEFASWYFWLGIGGVALGLLGFLALLAWNQVYARSDPIIRQFLTFYNFALTVCFLVGILVLANLLVAQYGYLVGLGTADWTSQKVYTLADVSRQLVRELKRPLKIVVFYPSGARQGQLRELLDLYKAANPQMVDYEVVDYLENQLKAQEYLTRYPDLQGQLPALLLIYGEGKEAPHRVVRDSELFRIEAELSLTQSFESRDIFMGENAITSTIRALIRDRRTKVYFTTGHGELDPDDDDPRSDRGAGLLRERLAQMQADVATVRLLTSEVPQDADLVVIAGPRSPFSPEEVRRLKDYLDRTDSQGRPRGSLLVLMDSPVELRPGVPADLGLGQLLRDYKVEVRDNLVVDAVANVGDPRLIVVQVPARAASHRLLQAMGGQALLFWMAREIRSLSEPEPSSPNRDFPPQPPSKVRATELIRTLSSQPQAWAEGDYGNTPYDPRGTNDTPGPVPLAVLAEAVQERSPSLPPGHPRTETTGIPRVLVVGDATFATNLGVSLQPPNQDFVLNAISWLTGRTEDVGIQPKTRRAVTLTLTRAQLIGLIVEPLFVLLGMAVAVAGVVWATRTNRLRLAWLPVVGLLVWCSLYGLIARAFIEEGWGRSFALVVGFCFLAWAASLGVAFLQRARLAAAS